jgi:hypothetical protein
MKQVSPIKPEGPKDLAQLRKELPAGQKKIVATVMAILEKDLIEVLPELNAGVQTSAAQGSWSPTLQIKKAKKGRFSATLGSRIRVPRESVELDMHVDDDGQLSLGLPQGWEPDGDPGGE